MGLHKTEVVSRYWSGEQVEPEFLQALGKRRQIQARKIIAWLKQSISGKTVLDYGTGQGYFFQQLLREGYEVTGCDFGRLDGQRVIPESSIIQIQTPWQVPKGEWSIVALLDVVEHHPTPSDLLRSFSNSDFVIKVPNANGPIAISARLLAKFGIPGPLKRLFLVGEVSPHRWLPTPKGIKSLACHLGYSIHSARPLPEVGTELPERARLRSDSVSITAIGRALGALLNLLGHIWSDTLVAIFEKPQGIRFKPDPNETPARYEQKPRSEQLER